MVGSGVYLYRLQADKHQQIRRLVLLIPFLTNKRAFSLSSLARPWADTMRARERAREPFLGYYISDLVSRDPGQFQAGDGRMAMGTLNSFYTFSRPEIRVALFTALKGMCHFQS